MNPADVLALIDATGTPPNGPHGPNDALDDEVRDHLHAAAALLRAATTLDAETARTYLDAARLLMDWAVSILDEIDGRE